MATRPDERMTEPVMDATDLWLEEVYTDRKIGTLRKLTPVKGDGARDPAREIQWVGETQVMSQIGTLPITFALEAKTLAEAATQFGPEAKKAIERTVRELQDLRRQAASSIVIPQGGMPPIGPGGVPGGGKIQMP
ncbi:MAG: hypothetical protein EPN19_01265 [Betaproteobacteria bacterium]|nr:MAG: hypothetical protein EPO29_04395 [Betaproteobacteria bacterium]TAN56257.1 MAG: hypothetical protein EPN19_01265 [Betaproteobacteria bacterium]